MRISECFNHLFIVLSLSYFQCILLGINYPTKLKSSSERSDLFSISKFKIYFSEPIQILFLATNSFCGFFSLQNVLRMFIHLFIVLSPSHFQCILLGLLYPTKLKSVLERSALSFPFLNSKSIFQSQSKFSSWRQILFAVSFLSRTFLRTFSECLFTYL